jgi:hypothetical protein
MHYVVRPCDTCMHLRPYHIITSHCHQFRNAGHEAFTFELLPIKVLGKSTEGLPLVSVAWFNLRACRPSGIRHVLVHSASHVGK